MTKIVIIIKGPSGSGKTYLLKKLVRFLGILDYHVSARDGGKDYMGKSSRTGRNVIIKTEVI